MSEPTRKDFRYFHRLRVRWVEVDMQKIVFNGHYLMYFDTAVADYWRALALPYEEITQRYGGDMFVRKATLEFHASAQYDDLVEVGVRCSRIGTSSLTFTTAMFCQNTVLVTGEVVYVFADAATRTSKPVPDGLRAMFEGYERGEPSVQVRLGAWAQMQGDAQPLRQAVFVHEQGIAAELEWDANDANCLHAVAYNRDGLPLGTGRLLPDGHIGRMAVIKAMRGSRVGAALLEALVDEARRRGHTQVVLNAQSHVAPFYRKHGFTTRGDEFVEAGIPHVEMVRAL